jgi:glutamine synthetase
MSDAVVERLREQGVDTLIVAGCDTYGMMRGKRLPIDQAARAFGHGMAMCDVFWVMHIDEADIVPRPDGHAGYFPTEKAGYPDILARPDLDTLRTVPPASGPCWRARAERASSTARRAAT